MQIATMKGGSGSSSYEDRVSREIIKIDEKIRALAAEREVLIRLLMKVRGEEASSPVARKNSGEKILAEKAIMDRINSKKDSSVSSEELFNAVKYTNARIKRATFRSYIHRLHKLGFIKRAGNKRGYWQKAES